MRRGLYVSLVTDVFSRRILGWRMSTKTTPLVTAALEQALFARRRGNARFTATGLVHQSGAGVAIHIAGVHRRAARCAHHRIDRLRQRRPGQGAHGATIGLFKTELIHRTTGRGPGGTEIERETAAWVQW